jgi:hypothetical protein
VEEKILYWFIAAGEDYFRIMIPTPVSVSQSPATCSNFFQEN